MQKYGILKDGKLQFVDEHTDGAKPVVFASIPDFDQMTQAVFPDVPIENDHLITVDYYVRDIGSSEGLEEEEPEVEFVEGKPWKDPTEREKEVTAERVEVLEGAITELLLSMYQ